MGPLLLLLSLSLPLPLLGSAASKSSSESVGALCGRLQYPDLCLSAINSVAKHHAGPIDARTAIFYIIKAVVEETKAVKKKGKALPKAVVNKPSEASQWVQENDPGFSPFPLKDCIQNFGPALDEMATARQKLKADDDSGTMFALGGFLDYVSVCKDQPTALQADAERLSRHVSNGLHLLAILYNREGST